MRYRMEDGTVLDTDLAQREWQCAEDSDGRNPVCRATGSQWAHETLYRSRRGRYYLVSYSQWEGTRPAVAWVTPEEAAAWLVLMEYEVPADLEAAAEELTE